MDGDELDMAIKHNDRNGMELTSIIYVVRYIMKKTKYISKVGSTYQGRKYINRPLETMLVSSR